MSSASPFRAGFGKVPPTLAGREPIIAAFTAAIEVGTWSTERATLLRGFRGVGKTVMIETLRRVAEDNGWVSIDETASAGFLDRMIDKLHVEIYKRDPQWAAPRITSIGIAPVGHIDFEYPVPAGARASGGGAAASKPSLESLIEALAELVEPAGGILFTLDEVTPATIDEFRLFTSAIQRSISRDREIALLIAGLQRNIAAILRDATSTFLRRADAVDLDLLDFASTQDAIKAPILAHGRTISDEAVDYGARAAQGYPFLTQLIGDLAWKQNQDSTAITLDDVRTAAQKSKRKMGASIHEPSLAGLTALERTVLAAMAQDDKASVVADLRERVGAVTPQHFNNIRNKLIDEGLVYAPKRGRLDFALPYLRDYLREHIVTDAMSATAASIATARAKFPAPPNDL